MKNERVLYSANAEQSLIGSLLIDNNSFDLISDIILADDFFSSVHQLIFQSISKLLNESKPADWVTVAEQLRTKGQLQEIGGEAYLVELYRTTPTSVNIKSYAKIIRDLSLNRKLKNAAYLINDLVESGKDDVIDEAEKIIFDIRDTRGNEPTLLGDGIELIFQQILERKESKAKLLGLSTGFDQIDNLTKGLRKQNLIILAARPGMGKTALSLNIARNVGVGQQIPVLYFSLEMSKEELSFRYFADFSSVHQNNVLTGNLSDQEQLKIAGSLETFNHAKIFIDDRAGLTIGDIRAKCRRIKRQHGLGLVVIDYLTLIHSDKKNENETHRISEISRSLKELAKELDVPFIALSQLNRSLESRLDKRPIMSDLRQSGQIEQDADIIIFIYRDAIYNEYTPDKRLTEIIVGKNRSGQPGKAYLTFKGEYCRFEDYNGVIPDQQPYVNKGFKPRSNRLNDE